MSSLQIKNLTITVNQKILISNFSLSISTGQIIGLYAPTGSGKSTLLNIIAGVENKDTVLYEGEIEKDYNQCAYVFQEPALLPQLTVLKNVMLPIEKLYGKKTAEDKATTMLHMLALENKTTALAKDLSGGEIQRTALARAFVYPGELILLDESFHAQDKSKKEQLITFTKELVQNENRMAIVVSHDRTELEKLGANIICL